MPSVWNGPIPSNSEFVDPTAYGAVPGADIDSVNGIIAAIQAASSSSRGDAQRVVDLKGFTYGISRSVSMVGTQNVRIVNGALNRLGSWTDYLIKTGNNTNLSCIEPGFHNMSLLSNGIGGGLELRNVRDADVTHVNVIGFSTYGMRAYNSGGPSTCYITSCNVQRHYYEDPNRGVFAERIGTAVSIESADCVVTELIAAYCGIPLYLNDFGGCNIIGGHFFNGAIDDFPQKSIAAVGVNGSGFLRVTTLEPHEFVTGDYVLLPFLTGVSTAENNIGKAAVQVTVVSGTIFDVIGYTPPAGVYAPAATQYCYKHEYEPTGMVVQSGARSVNLKGTQLDNGKLQIWGGANINFDGFFLRSGNGFNKTCVELVATAANEDFAGVAVKCGQVNSETALLRYHTPSPGSVSTNVKSQIFLLHEQQGEVLESYGRLSYPNGTKTSPAFCPTYETELPGTFRADNGSGWYSAGKYNYAYAVNGKDGINLGLNVVSFGDSTNNNDFSTHLKAAAGRAVFTEFFDGTIQRWRIGKNASNNWVLTRLDASGAVVGVEYSINSTTGSHIIGINSTTPVHRLNTLTETTVGAAGGASALPATPAGYIRMNIGGTERKIPFYNV